MGTEDPSSGKPGQEGGNDVPTKYNNKVVLGDEVLIDISSDTITASDLAYGVTAHDRTGAPITGTSTKDSDTTDATATQSEILATKTAYVNGTKVTGNMPNIGAQTITIDDVDDEISISQGYHDGSGVAKIDATEKAKIVPASIKDGVVILGVTGTYTGEGVTAQAKSATPTFSQQVIVPDSGYDYLSQVTVAAIPVTRTDNPQGGVTVTIG